MAESRIRHADFIKVGKKTWALFIACKTAPSEFQTVRMEVLYKLHCVMYHARNDLQDPDSTIANLDYSGATYLSTSVNGSLDMLDQLDGLLRMYRTAAAVLLERDGVVLEDVTARLMMHTSVLTALFIGIFGPKGPQIKEIQDIPFSVIEQLERKIEESLLDLRHKFGGYERNTLLNDTYWNDIWDSLTHAIPLSVCSRHVEFFKDFVQHTVDAEPEHSETIYLRTKYPLGPDHPNRGRNTSRARKSSMSRRTSRSRGPPTDEISYVPLTPQRPAAFTPERELYEPPPPPHTPVRKPSLKRTRRISVPYAPQPAFDSPVPGSTAGVYGTPPRSEEDAIDDREPRGNRRRPSSGEYYVGEQHVAQHRSRTYLQNAVRAGDGGGRKRVSPTAPDPPLSSLSLEDQEEKPRVMRRRSVSRAPVGERERERYWELKEREEELVERMQKKVTPDGVRGSVGPADEAKEHQRRLRHRERAERKIPSVDLGRRKK